MVVSPKIIGFEKKKDSTACLISNTRFLFGCRSFREKEGCFRGTWWSNEYPSFILLWLIRIFYHCKVQLFGIKFNGFVVISNEQCYMHK